ncbi:MAG: hypothetical protein J6V10_00150 [Clostridia bacterium]|nr:hypothetical protein [Clostridia bacterium]
MKRLTAIIVAILMALASFPFAFAANQEDSDGNFNPPDATTPIRMLGADYSTLGSVISTVGDTTRIGFVCPSWSDDVGNLTLTLWKWDTDYEKTIKSTPIAGPQVFENYEDNATLAFEFSEPLAAGVYYLQLSDAEDDAGSGVGVWSCEVKYPGQAVLRDGEFIDKLSLRMYVDYVTEPEGNRYGELPKFDKNDNGLGGDSMLPHWQYFKMSQEDPDSFTGEGNGITATVNEDGTMHVLTTAGAFDPTWSVVFENMFDFDIDESPFCQEYPIMAIRVKLCDNSYNAGAGEAFLYTTTIGGATAGYSAAIRYDWSNPDWQTVVIDPTSNSTFVKNALDGDQWIGFRFDMLNNTPKQDVEIDIDWIAFFQSEEAALAFDGDFSKIEEAKPTATPTAEPTATPEVTAAPEVTEAPEATEAPVDEPTEAPTDKPEKKSGCKTMIGGGAAVAVIALAALVFVKKKEN